jgi:hypothetical protein
LIVAAQVLTRNERSAILSDLASCWCLSIMCAPRFLRTEAVVQKAVCLVAATIAAGGLVSCGGTPPEPSGVVDGVWVLNVELVAPAALAPGATARLQMFEHRSDGSVVDVTPRASFSTRDAAVVSVGLGGLVTGIRVGEATIDGLVGARGDTTEIVVVPEGTVRVVGRVMEESTFDVPLSGVRVEADNGPSTTSDYDGRYRLYGVPVRGRLRFITTGYATKEVGLDAAGHHTVDTRLVPTVPFLDVAGLYHLTIEAGPECRGQIPVHLLKRHYTAYINQSGAPLEAVLGGATFGERLPYGGPGNVIPGRALPQAFNLTLSAPTHCEGTEPDYRLIEIVEGAPLVITGSAVLSPAGQGFTGTLTGWFQTYETQRCGSYPFQWCFSASHRMTLTR